MRQIALLAAVVVAMTVSGCGSPPPSNPVRSKVEEFAADAARHEYQLICDQVLATALLERLAAAGISCPGAVAGVLQGVTNPVVSIGKIVVSGAHASVVTLSAAAGQSAALAEIDLVREAAGWRISALGGGTGAGLR